MRIGYLIDLNKGGYDQPMPMPDDAHDTMEAMIQEGIIAEESGFHSLQVPHRHGRTECYLPGPEQILTVLARETEKLALGSFTYVGTLYHPMKGAEQFAVIDNLSKGRVYTTVSRGFHPGYWMQYGIPQEHLLGRFNEQIAIWQEAFKGERFDFDGKYWQVEQGCPRRSPIRRVAGRSGAGATRTPRRSGARPSTARPGPAIPRRSTRRSGTSAPLPTRSTPRSSGSSRSSCRCATAGSRTATRRRRRSSGPTT